MNNSSSQSCHEVAGINIGAFVSDFKARSGDLAGGPANENIITEKEVIEEKKLVEAFVSKYEKALQKEIKQKTGFHANLNEAVNQILSKVDTNEQDDDIAVGEAYSKALDAASQHSMQQGRILKLLSTCFHLVSEYISDQNSRKAVRDVNNSFSTVQVATDSALVKWVTSTSGIRSDTRISKKSSRGEQVSKSSRCIYG